MIREPIYAALFALIQTAATAAGAKTCSRKLRHWADVPPGQQPAIFQIQRNETSEQRKRIPAKWTLNVDVYVYVNTSDDPKAAPSTLLNPILDALEEVMPPDEEAAGGPQTLGGLVSHCWIAGTIETSEGVLGDQEVAIIPVEIVGAE
jgi:hypothetical protein